MKTDINSCRISGFNDRHNRLKGLPCAVLSLILSILPGKFYGQGPGTEYYYYPEVELSWASCNIHFDGGSRMKVPFLPVICFKIAPMRTGRYSGDIDVSGIRFPQIGDDDGESYFTMNFFFLIFDGLKMFPGFRRKMEDFQKKELKAWTGIIRQARAKGEIKSSLSDKHIAMIFIHTSDGVAMNLTLGGNTRRLNNEIRSIWDKFYETLKA